MAGEKVNRTYKDSLFRMIFREKEELLSLYNAVNESSYTNSEELEIFTIEDAIYMGMKNDVAFLIHECLNLYEAQSTLNPNMPLRGVFYLSDMYKGYIGQNKLDIYSKARLKLPAPKFVVFYNGSESKLERWTERLSDSFRLQEGEEPVLECTALVLNINYGCNKTLMENCRKLYEYSYFVAEVREKLETGYKLEAAVPRAIENCIQNGILEDFLRRHRMEVTQLILTEYDEELHIKSEKELSKEEGKAEERERGIHHLIEACKKMGVSREMAFEQVMSQYALNEEQTEKYMKEFWKPSASKVIPPILTEYDEELHIKSEKELSREEGKAEEKERGICHLVEACQELEVSREKTFEMVMSKYTLTGEQTEEYMTKYWKNA